MNTCDIVKCKTCSFEGKLVNYDINCEPNNDEFTVIYLFLNTKGTIKREGFFCPKCGCLQIIL